MFTKEVSGRFIIKANLDTISGLYEDIYNVFLVICLGCYIFDMVM